MNLKLFAKSILLVLVAVLAGCSSNESQEDSISNLEEIILIQESLANAPEQIMAKEDIPVWISERFSLEDTTRRMAVYQGHWNRESVYFVQDSYFSQFTGKTFNSHGEYLYWPMDDYKKLWKSAKDWKCIYKINGLF